VSAPKEECRLTNHSFLGVGGTPGLSACLLMIGHERRATHLITARRHETGPFPRRSATYASPSVDPYLAEALHQNSGCISAWVRVRHGQVRGPVPAGWVSVRTTMPEGAWAWPPFAAAACRTVPGRGFSSGTPAGSRQLYVTTEARETREAEFAVDAYSQIAP
jgi:hypothetical protein